MLIISFLFSLLFGFCDFIAFIIFAIIVLVIKALLGGNDKHK